VEVEYKWKQVASTARAQYQCGYCGNRVGPNQCYTADTSINGKVAFIFICPTCTKPTFVDVAGEQRPAPRLGGEVTGISEPGVHKLYNEARDCTSVGAYTAAAMLCRKILMHLAVQHGAKPGDTFAAYVDYLQAAGYVPPNGKEWVDEIRKKGNESNHEVIMVDQADAERILAFTEMLLRFSYEFQSMLKKTP
jgi:Domain of unknown function (DUF4145)